MKIVAGGGRKKSEILGGSAKGCPAKGCPAEGCPAEGCPAEGCPEEGSSGRVHRKWGAGRVQKRFLGTKTETEQKQNEER